jgi:hypothetical protein
MEKNSEKNSYSPNGKINHVGMHERIKELLGENVPRREAVLRAKQEMKSASHGDVGTITPKDVYRSKYQAEAHSPNKQVSPLTAQVQEYPFM